MEVKDFPALVVAPAHREQQVLPELLDLQEVKVCPVLAEAQVEVEDKEHPELVVTLAQVELLDLRERPVRQDYQEVVVAKVCQE